MFRIRAAFYLLFFWAGFKDWEKKLKVTAGSNVHLNAELQKAPNP